MQTNSQRIQSQPITGQVIPFPVKLRLVQQGQHFRLAHDPAHEGPVDFNTFMHLRVGPGWRVVKRRARDRFDIARAQAGLPPKGRKLLPREYDALHAEWRRLAGQVEG